MTGNDVGEWARRYGSLVFAACAKVLRDREAALDASQRVWEIVIRNGASFKGYSKPGTWIYAIAYREAVRAAKKEKRARYRELLAGYHDPGWRPAMPEGNEESARAWLSGKCDSCVTGVILTLPFKSRIVFTFRYLLGLSFTEIAESVGMREDAVRQAASRARKTLANFLERECGIYREARACRCGLENHLDRASFRQDMLALKKITRIARALHEKGSALPPPAYWEKIDALCHKTEAADL